MSPMCQLHPYLKFDTLVPYFRGKLAVSLYSVILSSLFGTGGGDFRKSYSVVISKGRAFAKNGKNIRLFSSLRCQAVEKTLPKKSPLHF